MENPFEELTQHFETERLGYAEQISVKEQDISAKEPHRNVILMSFQRSTWKQQNSWSNGKIGGKRDLRTRVRQNQLIITRKG